jgi:ubiquinone/menaquinone biosynthesis C-methylase UbiE
MAYTFSMGHVFDAKDAVRYEAWCAAFENAPTERARRQLITRMARPMPHERVLDIGCGTGRDLSLFLNKTALLAGVDPSSPMLSLASRRLGNRAALERAFGEDLPFEDNAFDLALCINTLEFAEDPQKMLAEACRVAKDRVFIGCANRYALEIPGRRIGALCDDSLRSKARTYSVWELKALVRATLGEAQIQWRTCGHLPLGEGRCRDSVERVNWIQRLPSGVFVAMLITLCPRFRVTPLELRIPAPSVPKLATGPARVGAAGRTFKETAHGSSSV